MDETVIETLRKRLTANIDKAWRDAVVRGEGHLILGVDGASPASDYTAIANTTAGKIEAKRCLSRHDLIMEVARHGMVCMSQDAYKEQCDRLLAYETKEHEALHAKQQAKDAAREVFPNYKKIGRIETPGRRW